MMVKDTAARKAVLEKEMEKSEALQVQTGFQQLLNHSEMHWEGLVGPKMDGIYESLSKEVKNMGDSPAHSQWDLQAKLHRNLGLRKLNQKNPHTKRLLSTIPSFLSLPTASEMSVRSFLYHEVMILPLSQNCTQGLSEIS